MGKVPECIITSPVSDNKYTVEVKLIHRLNVLGVKSKNNAVKSSKRLKASIGEHISNALKKYSAYPRIIFLELNKPDNKISDDPNLLNEIIDAVKEKEVTLPTSGSAYLIITNNPCHRYGEETSYVRQVLFLGFRMPDFDYTATHQSLKERYYSNKKHKDIMLLIESMHSHYQIPVTFNGGVPEFEFGSVKNDRLLIGNRYQIPDENGIEVVGKLINATVVEKNKTCFGIYHVDHPPRNLIVTTPLNESELIAYKQHPETFFGVINHMVNHYPISGAVELFDFYIGTYSKTPKEKLLQFMNAHPEIERLKQLDQEELAVTYCESITLATLEQIKAD